MSNGNWIFNPSADSILEVARAWAKAKGLPEGCTFASLINMAHSHTVTISVNDKPITRVVVRRCGAGCTNVLDTEFVREIGL